MAALPGIEPRPQLPLRPQLLQAALCKITEALARELAEPTQAAPDWSEFEWRIARVVAAMHGISPLLAGTLRWRGPAAFADFLAQQRAHTAHRHARIVALSSHLYERCRCEDIAALALKGAALHALGLYAPGERPMADLDLLVRPVDAARTAALIVSMGYHESRTSARERVFTPKNSRPAAAFGEHSDNDIKIELHERIAESLPRRQTDISSILLAPRAAPGLCRYPSKAALMLHLTLHAAGTMVIKALRFLQLQDIAGLARRMQAADWTELLAAHLPASKLWWALPPLQLTVLYYRDVIPPRVLSALEAGCPRLLAHVSRRRRLSDVSHTHLWVNAFPGIEWSSSISEMVSLCVGRIRPSAAVRELRRHDAQTQVWASGNAWSGLSQPRRMLRFLISRPTRPTTMHAVRAALAQAAE